MVENQAKIDSLTEQLRKQVIAALLVTDRRKFGAQPLSADEYEWTAMENYKMPCPTRLLKRLFEDCHEMQNDKGQMLHAVNVGELEWCLKNRCIGYASVLNVKHGWLPKKSDTELRKLPAFVELKTIYKAAKRVIAPTTADNAQTLEISNLVKLQRI